MPARRRSYLALFASVRPKTRIIIGLFICSLLPLPFHARLPSPRFTQWLVVALTLDGSYCAFVCFLHRILSLTLFLLGQNEGELAPARLERAPETSMLETCVRLAERLWPFALTLYALTAAIYVVEIAAR